MHRLIIVAGIVAVAVAACNTIYVITGKGGTIEDNNSVERKVDIDKSRKQSR